MSLSNGVLPANKKANELLTAENGTFHLQCLRENQLVKRRTGFYKLFKKLKLSTFSKLKKSVKLKIEDVVQLTAEKNIFGRIAIVSQQRNTEMEELFCYPLGPISWALAGSMKKMNKVI